MQSVSSRIWTRVAVSISYDDNHYTTSTSKLEVKKFIHIQISKASITNLLRFDHGSFLSKKIKNKKSKRIFRFNLESNSCLDDDDINLISRLIIIKSRWEHGVPWLFLATRHCHPLLRIGLLDLIQCPLRTDIWKP